MSSAQGRQRPASRKRAESIVFDLMLLDGPPWGFALGGGEEVGTNLVVTEIDLRSSSGRKIRLLRGDEIVTINEVPVSELSKAKELMENAGGELLLTVRRKRVQANRSSYHENSIDRNSFSNSDPARQSTRSSSGLIETTQGRRQSEAAEGKVMRSLSRTMTYQGVSSVSTDSSRKPPSTMLSEDKRHSISREQSASPSAGDSVKRVTVKSVNVPGSVATSQDTYSTYLSSQQTQANRASFRARQSPSSKRYEGDIRFQSRSFSSLTNVGREGALPNPYQHWKEGPNPDVECTSNMNVASAKAMFEEISKSQENLLNIGLPQKQQRSDRRSTIDAQQRYRPSLSTSSSGYVSSSKSGSPSEAVIHRRPLHSHSNSLPSDLIESSHETHPQNQERAKSGEAVNVRHQFSPPKPTPSPPPRYSRSKLLSSFREKRRSQPVEIFEQFNASQSVEDLRQLHLSKTNGTESHRRVSSDIPPWGPAEQPATEMREAAKRYHQQVGQRHPAAYRYSVGGNETAEHFAKAVRSASIDAGAIGLERPKPPEVAAKPHVVSDGNHLSSTSSTNKDSYEDTYDSDVFPSPSFSHEPIDGEMLMTKLMREEQLSKTANLIRIEEERHRSGNSSVGVSSSSSCNSPPAAILQPSDSDRESAQEQLRGSREATPTLNRSHHVEEGAGDDEENEIFHAKEASLDSMDELENIRDGGARNLGDDDLDELPPPPDELLMDTPVVVEKKPTRTINRRKRDAHNGQSRSSSCVSTDSTASTATSDSGIVFRSCLSTDSSPRTSPLSGYRSQYDSDDPKNDDDVDEAFGGSRDMLDDCGEDDRKRGGFILSQSTSDTPSSSAPNSRRSSAYFSPKLEALDSEKSKLVHSMHEKIGELKEQEREIADEINTNDALGEKVRAMVERCATQTEFSKYELFIGELNKIVVLLLSLTQRLHRYELMLQDLDMAEDEDKQKRDMLISKIEKLRSQHEEACNLRDVNDKRGENVAIFLERYCDEEEFADFQYFIDMKSQLALMQSEIKEKVKLGEERLKALESAALDWSEPESEAY